MSCPFRATAPVLRARLRWLLRLPVVTVHEDLIRDAQAELAARYLERAGGEVPEHW